MGVINRKIDPNRRMQRQHPYDVWRALNAMRMRDMALNQDLAFYTPEDIARVLYINFDDLMPMDRTRVLTFKLSCSIRCLAGTCFAEEKTNYKHIEDRWGYREVIAQGEGTYRARDNVFNIAGWTRQMMLDSTRSGIDRDWARYIGRRGAFVDYLGYPG